MGANKMSRPFASNITPGLPNDIKDMEDKGIVGTDVRGHNLSHWVLAERLIQLEYSTIKTEVLSGDVSEVLAYVLEGGFRGYHKMTGGELWSEWQNNDAEARWYKMFYGKNLDWTPDSDDPASA